VAVAATLGIAASTTAQIYSSRPITIIVPFPAGGSSDVLTRILAERMRVSIGHPVIIDNVAAPPAGPAPAGLLAPRPMATRSALAALVRTWRMALFILLATTC
jgi:hypothetical protein